MNKYTKEEIIEKAKEIWSKDSRWPRTLDTIEVEFKGDIVHLTLGSMYEAPGLDLEKLLKLSEFFGTQRIRDERYAYGGCDSCDYGSDYGFTLIIGEPK